MSTHYMIEAETLCDRLAIMITGNILDIGEPDEVVRHHVGAEVAMLQIGDSATREERAALRHQLNEEGRDYSEVGTSGTCDGTAGYEAGCLDADGHS